MSYVQHVLQPEETVRFQTTIHWIVYLPAIFFAVIGCAGVVLFMHDRQDPIALGLLGVGFVLAILMFIPAWFRRWTTEIAVTSRRIIFKVGFIRRRTIEMNMEKVESVDVNQSVLGRVFDYGDILVRGTGSSLEPFHNIETPIQFRNSILAR